MTRTGLWILAAAGLALLASAGVAVADQVPVNIVYPVNGGTYPLVDPRPADPISSVYQPFSFSTTCPGGGQMVEWGVDGDTLGEARFYDEFSAQFVMKIGGGPHVFWVRSSCGENKVEFTVAGARRK